MQRTWRPRPWRRFRAFVSGLNAALRYQQQTWRLPFECTILNHTPKPFTILDVLLLELMLTWSLSGDYQRQLVHFGLAVRLGLARAAELVYSVPGHPSSVIAAPAAPGQEPGPAAEQGRGIPVSGAAAMEAGAAGRVLMVLEAWTAPFRDAGVLTRAAGSNCWAVSGAHTATGKPLLANDTHLPIRSPSFFFLSGSAGGKTTAAAEAVVVLVAVVMVAVGWWQR